LRDQLRAVDGTDDQASLDRLLAEIGARPPTAWELRSFNLKNARSRAETIALLRRGPLDREGPVSQKALLSSDRVAREIFASADLVDQPEDVKRLAKTAANRVVLDAAHTGLQAELRRLADDPVIMASHLIDPETVDALRGRDIPRFLRLRGDAVRAEIETLLERRAGWDEPTLRPRAAFLDEEDGE
jgi:hypothetical protein